MLVFKYGLPSQYPLSEDNGVVPHETNEETRREKALGQNRGETSQKIRPHKWLTSDVLSKHFWDVYHPFF